jgi:hypothetical protein
MPLAKSNLTAPSPLKNKSAVRSVMRYNDAFDPYTSRTSGSTAAAILLPGRQDTEIFPGGEGHELADQKISSAATAEMIRGIVKIVSSLPQCNREKFSVA